MKICFELAPVCTTARLRGIGACGPVLGFDGTGM